MDSDNDNSLSDSPHDTEGKKPRKVEVQQQSAITTDAKPGNQIQQPPQVVLEEFWAKFNNK